MGQPNVSMLRLILLVALASLCSAGGGGVKEKMMKKYAHYKIMEGCFGAAEIKKYKVMMVQWEILTSKKSLTKSGVPPFKWVPTLHPVASTTNSSLCYRMADTNVMLVMPLICSNI